MSNYFKYNFVLTEKDIEALLSNNRETIEKVFDAAKFTKQGCEAGREIGLKEGIALGKKIGFRNALIVCAIFGGGYLTYKRRNTIKKIFGYCDDEVKKENNDFKDEIIDETNYN